jgi:hypothetical protein
VTESLFDAVRRTQRGFRVYADTTDHYGAEVSIVESSSAEESQIWIQIHAGERDSANRQDSSALFSVPQARQFALALLRACEEQGE